MGHFLESATISDGVNEKVFEVEIFTRPGENALVTAWHVQIQGQVPHELRFPSGKTVSVRLADGREGVGTLVDPHLIRGVGQPPCS